MADPEPQDQQKSGSKSPASSTPRDYYAALAAVISGVTHDPTLLRKLVYALAWQNLKPEVIVAQPIPKAQTHAKSIPELAQALQFERAIERIENEAREQTATLGHTVVPGFDPEPPAWVAQNLIAQEASVRDLIVKGAGKKNLDVNDQHAKDPTIKVPDTEELQASSPPPRTDSTVSLADQRSSPERKDISHLEWIPLRLDSDVHISPGLTEYTPTGRPSQGRFRFVSNMHLIGASMIGVVLVIGIFGFTYLGRQSTGPTLVGASKLTPQKDQMRVQAPVVQPVTGPQPSLPFPLPKSYGVHAGSSGQSFELEPLPIKIPDSQTLVSAEITKPSIVTLPGENLAFVAFAHELVNSAPQTIAVHVVARVQRTTRFVGGQLAIVPLESSWRMRNKAYEFKATPFEGNSEMVVIRPNPGFVFAPGRYALVLNGSGYDFTVAGTITAVEQCLEQVETVNGAVLSECPRI